MELLSILGIVITATVFAVVLGQYKSEYALGVAAVAGVIILLRIIRSVATPLLQLNALLSKAGIDNIYFEIALKTLGVCFITGFVSDVCRDFGQTALSGWAQAAGKCVIFIMSVPILTELIGVAYSFIGK